MKDEELIEKTDRAISELVIDKVSLRKAYNYYNGKMDKDQFKFIEDTYGIGSPTSVEFIPLIKKHVDALLGEYLGTPIIPKVSCKDKGTINNIFREKQLLISNEISNFFQRHLRNSLLQFADGKDITDKNIEQQLNTLIEDLEQNFVSQYEIAAQNVLEYIMQSKETDIYTKLRQLLLDLLITGYTFYRVKPSSAGSNVEIEVLNPLDTFVDRNFDSPYIKNSYRAVVRKWLTINQVLNQYGKDLSKSEIKQLKEDWREMGGYDGSTYYVRTTSSGLMANTEVTPDQSNYNDFYYKKLPVYEVEWTETDDNFVMQRYRTVRIGGPEETYILLGKDENVIRSKDCPDKCGLTVNGVYFLNRSNEPYSLVLACASMQDKYNLLHYYRDNLIANSGTVGDWIDETLIPAHLGVNFPERLKKWIQYKKQGIGVINTQQEGAMSNGQAPINTIFNGFDDTVKAQAIQAINMAIDSIEQTTSSITGVFRERLNGIEQRDAVTNVKQGATNSFIITKPIYQQMDLVTGEILLDSLNTGKVVYKKGLTGTLILGEKYQKIFTALPENFTVSDYDIHIITSTSVLQEMEQIKAVIPDLIKSGAFTPEIIFEALTTKSLTELKYKVNKAMRKQKEENNQLNQALQQVEQLNQQLQQAQSELQKAQTKIESLNEQQLQLDKQRLKAETELEWYKAQTDRTYKQESNKIDEKKVEVELYQIRDGNPYNDKVNFDK